MLVGGFRVNWDTLEFSSDFSRPVFLVGPVT
jgi:hypothetical protein